MSQQIINVGSSPNDGQGDGLRTAYIKCNNNFTELYANIARPQSMGDGGSNITVGYPSGPIQFTVNNVSNVMVVKDTGVDVNGIDNIVGNTNITGNAFITGTTTLAGNALVLGNITAGGIKTNGYYWANGTPINFSAAAGSNTQVIYNNAGNAAGSAAFTFDQSSNAVSMLGNLYVGKDTILNGNLTVNGTTVTANATVLNVQDPIIGLGRGANNTPLVANDGKDRGEQLWYYTTSEKSAFTGYQNSSGKILLATDVTITNEIVTVNALGNVVLGNAEATTVSASGNITGGNLNSLGVVSSVGTVFAGNISTTGFVTAAGNVTGGNINTAGLVSAGGNITGGNLNTAGAVTALSMSVTGNITAGNIIGNVSGTAANSAYATIAGTAYSVNGANVTGTLSVNTTGSAATLTTARNINGVAFNGSADITVTANASTLTSTTLNSTVVTSSLTTVGILNSGSITSGFGAIDIGTDTVTCGGIVNSNANGVGNIGSSTTYFNTVFAKATSAQYADLAEMYCSDYPYEPGTVVSFGGGYEITLSLVDMDRTIAGVVSTDPAHLMNSNLDCVNAVAVALQGRVPCKVTGPVRKGDMMVSAGGGYARAEANPTVGSVIGKALANHPGGEGVIEVVVGRI